jgi:hypothetical protein
MSPNLEGSQYFDFKQLATHGGISIILVLASWAISSIAYWHAAGIAENWTKPLQPQLRLLAASTDKFCNPPTSNHHGGLEDRLEDDFKEIRGRMQHHLDVMMYFYANFFRAIIMASLVGAVSGICLFYIANKGWANANNYAITTFVVSTVIAAYFLSFITVFKVQENISDNKALYLQYVALGNQLISYCATATTDDESVKSEDQYIRQIDRKMATINDIAIGFDYTKIADYKAILSTSTQNRQQTPSPQVGRTAPSKSRPAKKPSGSSSAKPNQ